MANIRVSEAPTALMISIPTEGFIKAVESHPKLDIKVRDITQFNH